MKKEQFYEILGEVNEKTVKAAEKPPVRQKKYKWVKYGVAAVACIAVFAGFGGWYMHSNMQPSPYNDTANNTNNMVLAAAAYPEMPMYPDENADEKSYQKWKNSKATLRNLPEEYKEEFDTFFSNSTQTFLLDAAADNKIYSPLSLYMALGMSAEISDGNTRQQILDVLEQSNIDALRSRFKSIWNANYIDDGMAKCVLANSLWTNNDFSYTQSTLDSIAENYYSSVFTGNPDSDEYNKLMQNWLNEQTDDLLSDYVSNIKMSPEMVLTLASTVNYSGKWNYKFSEELTKSGTFHSPTADVQCDFMNAENSTTYFWGDKFSSVSMELENNGQMKLILPDEGISPEELILDDEAISYMTSIEYENSKYVTVNLSVPKFDVSSSIDLKDGLQKLGITDMFDSSKSDFSPLSENAKGIMISKAEQDTRVIIDEEGCKASSLTIMAYYGAGMPEDYIDFILDRPFIFEIISESGLPLFVGIVNNPAVN